MFLRRPRGIGQLAHSRRSRLSTPHTIEPLEERRMMALVSAPILPGQTEALYVEQLIVPGDDENDISFDTRVRPDQLTVTFYQTLDVSGGATGLHSASNPANWKLLSGDADSSHLISSIEVNGDTAILHLQGPLSAGTYRLRLGDNLQSASGLAIRDGNPERSYAVELPEINVLPLLETAPTSSIAGDSNRSEVTLYRLQVDAQGNYAVLFERLEVDTQLRVQSSVRLQRFNSAGVKLGGEILITAEKWSGAADLAMNASGEFIVSWRRSAAEINWLYVRRFNAAGAAIGDVITIESPTNGGSPSHVAIDDAGRAVVAWSSYDALAGEQIWAQRIAADGTRDAERFLVGSGSSPLLIKSGAGDFTIAWTAWHQSAGGVFAQHFRADGTLRGGRVQVDSTGMREELRDLEVDPSGGFVVVTSHTAAGISDARLRRYDSEGRLREPLHTLLSKRAAYIENVQLTLAPDGRSILRWGERRDSPSDSVLSRSWTAQYATILDQQGREVAAPFLSEESYLVSASGRIVSVQDRKLTTAVTNEASAAANSSKPLHQKFPSLIVVNSPAEGIFIRHLRFPDQSVVDLNGDPPGVNIKRNFVPGGSPAMLADPDSLEILTASETITSAKITIEGYQPGDTLLTYSLNPKIFWSFSAGVLTLTGGDTVAGYEALLNDIWFKTTANRAAGSKVTIRVVVNDSAGESAPAYSFISIHVPGRSSIAGRHLFYNNSAYDGSDLTANAADDAAIATDKSALLPGQTATKANYTGYSRGINGIMVDLAGSHGTIEVDDFIFRIGNSNDPSTWAYAPTPSSIVVRPGAGVGGADRVVVTWADGVIANTWLQVIVLDNGDTGLAAPDIFYFGNRIGDTGNESHRAQPQSTEALQIINRLRSASGGVEASITDPLDINRDGRINSQDMLAMFNAIRLQKSALNMIRTGGGQAGMGGAIITGGVSGQMISYYAVTGINPRAAPLAAAFTDWNDEDATECRLPAFSLGPLMEDPDDI